MDLLSNWLYDLWNPEAQIRIYKGSPIIPIVSRINVDLQQ